jgi:hypothetical protein
LNEYLTGALEAGDGGLEQTVLRSQHWPFGRPIKYGELMSQGEVFRREFDARREEGSNKEQEGMA